MPSFTRILAVPLLLLLPADIHADALCILCFTTFRAPGGADSGGAGLYRLRGCPCCQPEDCKTAAQRAQGLRNRYKALRQRYEQLNQEIAKLRSSGQPIPTAKVREQANMNFDLGQLEMQYSILNADCPTQVPGENVWDGLYGGPVEDSPVSGPKDDAARASKAATQAAASYDRLSQTEQQQLEAITGFLNSSASGFSPPPTGYNGQRAQATRGYRTVADAYRKEAQLLTKGGAAKPDPKADLTKPAVPKFPDIKIARDAASHVQNQGIAARARLEANIYILAYLQARESYRQALATGNKVAAKTHARLAVEFAFQAKGYAQWAADHQHKADAAHQKMLDERLEAAAKKGLTLAELLKNFQSQIKKEGLPAQLRDALTAAGATAEELDAVKDRLLALTPEAVETVLKERRTRVKTPEQSAQAPDALFLGAQLMAARHWFHQQVKK